MEVPKLNRNILIDVLEKITEKTRNKVSRLNRKYNGELIYKVEPSWNWRSKFNCFDQKDLTAMCITHQVAIEREAIIGFMSFTDLMKHAVTGVHSTKYAYIKR